MVDMSASVNLPLHHKVRSSLLAPAHLDGPGKRAVKWLWQWCGLIIGNYSYHYTVSQKNAPHLACYNFDT